MTSRDDFLFSEKYRPRRVEDCILPDSIKNVFLGILSQGRVPNMLLSGTPGSGKTTVARAVCEQVGVDYIIINTSNENGIDTFRNKIMQFASSVSLTDAKKVVILDEFDHSTPALQAVLRAGLEEVSSNCTFIMTCNFKSKIMDALHSRCMCIDFKIAGADKPAMAAAFYKRIVEILGLENIQYDNKVILELITKYFPDYRRIINELQRYSTTGKIDAGILVNVGEGAYNKLLTHLKEKNFTEVRKWVAKLSGIDTTELFRFLYDRSADVLQPQSVPQLILVLGEYGYRAAFVADPEINIMAALTEIMSSCTFK